MTLFKNTLEIIEELKNDKYHSSIITSYSLDMNFYERFVLHSLRSAGCKNNMVIVDAYQFQSSLRLGYTKNSLIGKYYSVIPYHCRGSFHPKVISLFGENKIKFLIGSGNLNLGGFLKSFEAFYKVEINVEDETFHPIARSIWSFIKTISRTNKKIFTYKQLNSIEQEYSFLRGDSQLLSQMISENIPIFLCHNDSKSILDQFLEKINSKVKRLVIVSPFYDKDSATVNLLIKSLKPENCDIIVQEDSVSINKSTFPMNLNISLYRLPNNENTSYLHAKIYIVISNNVSHMLIGSSNCTRSGLGEKNKKSDNIEACVYCLSNDSNRWLQELELDKILITENKLKLSDSSVKFKSSTAFGKGLAVNLISADFINGDFIVLVDKCLQHCKYEFNSFK